MVSVAGDAQTGVSTILDRLQYFTISARLVVADLKCSCLRLLHSQILLPAPATLGISRQGDRIQRCDAGADEILCPFDEMVCLDLDLGKAVGFGATVNLITGVHATPY